MQRRDCVRLIYNDEVEFNAGHPAPREHLMDEARDCPGVLVYPGAAVGRTEHYVRDALGVHLRQDSLQGMTLPRPGIPEYGSPQLCLHRRTAVLVPLAQDISAFLLHVTAADRSPGQPPHRGQARFLRAFKPPGRVY